jgi:hypothetical protein
MILKKSYKNPVHSSEGNFLYFVFYLTLKFIIVSYVNSHNLILLKLSTLYDFVKFRLLLINNITNLKDIYLFKS